jgi:hypothetical protein
VEYIGLTSQIYPGTETRDNKGNVIGGKTYAQVANEGILAIWNANNLGGNEFDFDGFNVSVITDIINKENYTGPEIKFMKIELDDEVGGGVTHGTGTIGKNPDIYLTSEYKNGLIDTSQFGRAAAHEFGHALAIGDAYGDTGKNRDPAPNKSGEVPKSDIMRGSYDGSALSANDVEMVLQAWKTGERQDFTSHMYGWFGFFHRNKSSVIKADEK